MWLKNFLNDASARILTFVWELQLKKHRNRIAGNCGAIYISFRTNDFKVELILVT